MEGVRSKGLDLRGFQKYKTVPGTWGPWREGVQGCQMKWLIPETQGFFTVFKNVAEIKPAESRKISEISGIS